MLSGPAILLTICGVMGQVSAETAPELPPLPAGLSAPVAQPDGAICLPADLADAVDTQREQCRQLPARCQARLDVLKERCELQARGWLDDVRAGIVGAGLAAVAIVLAMGLGGSL